MAFRHSTYHAPHRTFTLPSEPQQIQAPLPSPSEHIADSQEWILFSPSQASGTDRGYTTSTARTQTAGRSRISDFGSLDTAERSNGYDFDHRSEEAIEEEDDDGEEDGELDSLDSHLYEFGAEPSVYRSSGMNEGAGEKSTTVLPTHDGLGSFRLDQTAMGENVQEQLYAFERYNPRRVKRQRESLETGQMELDGDRVVELERTRMIEKWRMEQSQLLVDEIQKETRRRKQSMSSERKSVVADQVQEDSATLNTVGSEEYLETELGATDANESFWNRITKRVIQDLMGIDDDLLSIIFGESIPLDDDLSSTPPANQSLSSTLVSAQQPSRSAWEYRLLERIARELGLLVSQLTDHPGAFSTYLQTQTIPLPYAGLPVIPESSHPQQAPTLERSINEPEFLPTIPNAIPIPTTSTSLGQQTIDEDSTPRQSATLTREEWERDLDIKMVFRYLRSRFISKFTHSTPPLPLSSSDPTSFTTSHLATASTSETAARAARVRQHHPLVTSHNSNHRRSIERRTFKVSIPAGSSGVLGGGIGVRRGSSSCASERLSVGKRRSEGGSSRHYWDFGGSVGSGSRIGAGGAGGMGSWGEV